MRCTSCQMLRISGVPCHEVGCPDAWADQERDCVECGAEFRPESRDERCCSEECWRSYTGTSEDEDNDGGDLHRDYTAALLEYLREIGQLRD